MKIRNGFVSNSSSSSFVLLIKKDAYEKALKNYKPTEEFVEWMNENECSLKSAFNEWYNEKQDVFGTSCVMHADLTVQDYSNYDDVDSMIAEEAYEFERIIDKKDKIKISIG